MKIAATQEEVKKIFGEVKPPEQLDPLIQRAGGSGSTAISNFLSSVIFLLYEIALVAVTIYLIWGAVEWIFSGGDKEKVGAARKRITTALVGLILLAVVFAILNVFEVFTGFEFFGE